ncbi:MULTISPECIES: MHYT domain-containing protein [unclassified Streptomyces]|uniref:MHYT domain-containing protein n=1 Tax=unclassified Streptomyces TaxID=2593676 RepID=UPI0004C0401D|nr:MULTISPECIES: MHYT domain-containing protein [unclassified Streptomyces]
MDGTVDGFRYGAVTPVAAYLMACLGGALGLRCIVRTLLDARSWKPGWLALGATAIGCGIWTMHFIAMIGFHVEETRVRYDAATTVLSLVVAVAVVGIGVFVVGYRGTRGVTLAVAGVVTGLGVAVMHYLGMAAMRLNGDIGYHPAGVALSVLIAIAAATVALWSAVTIRGFLTSLGASLVMGVAVSGMHYTGMAAVSVRVHDTTGGTWDGESPLSLLLPMLLGPVVFLLLAGVLVMCDPLLVQGNRAGGQRTPAAGPDASGSARATNSVTVSRTSWHDRDSPARGR